MPLWPLVSAGGARYHLDVNEISLLAIPGGWELFVVLGVILLLFGSAKLPKLARSLGSSVTEFKKGVKSGDSDDDPNKIDPPKGGSESGGSDSGGSDSGGSDSGGSDSGGSNEPDADSES